MLIAVASELLGTLGPAQARTIALSPRPAYLSAQGDTPIRRRRRRRARGDWSKHKKGGIGHEYAESGRSVGRGSRRFGKNMGHGRPLHAGASFGRGMGGFGKHFGKGTAKVGKRIVKH
jgi:hypothetical protein